jgi:hypothetical protein
MQDPEVETLAFDRPSATERESQHLSATFARWPYTSGFCNGGGTPVEVSPGPFTWEGAHERPCPSIPAARDDFLSAIITFRIAHNLLLAAANVSDFFRPRCTQDYPLGRPFNLRHRRSLPHLPVVPVRGHSFAIDLIRPQRPFPLRIAGNPFAPPAKGPHRPRGDCPPCRVVTVPTGHRALNGFTSPRTGLCGMGY